MEGGLSFEDLKLDGEGTFCLKVSSWMRGDFRFKISRLTERGLSFESCKVDFRLKISSWMERGLSA